MAECDGSLVSARWAAHTSNNQLKIYFLLTQVSWEGVVRSLSTLGCFLFFREMFYSWHPSGVSDHLEVQGKFALVRLVLSLCLPHLSLFQIFCS
jgi:hypothetical protein